MQLIEPILYIGISQSFFAGLLLATRKPFTTANKLMAAWLFLICFELIFALVNSTLLPFYSFPFIAFTYGPLLYLYARQITARSNRFNYFNILHFIPFLVFFAVSVWQRDYQMFRNPTAYLRPDGMITLRIVYGISFFISISLYSILTFIVIRNHQRDLKNNLSYTSIAATLNWLKIISISFYSVYLILFILGGINIVGNYIPFDPYYIIFIFIAVLSFAYSFYGVRQPELFALNAPEETEDNDEAAVNGQEKYSRSGLRQEQAGEMLATLLELMNEKKYYLDRNLTIYDLAGLTGISRHHITQILNEEHGCNFYTFINDFRVREASARLQSEKYRNYTILAIAYDSGFNSKSVFNKIFKEQMGVTPSEYRDRKPSD
ncbi:MAG: helix-turn-helix transcriptional regulator [Bacteroidales bacterium]|jgi:AraC-like DNA-binding protein|nr:helix-turn-helix transcriptional regulator [Bacteroidales bacterium]